MRSKHPLDPDKSGSCPLEGDDPEVLGIEGVWTRHNSYISFHA
jgi:hypothetical protein